MGIIARETRSLVDMVAQTLRQEIASGVYGAGAKLPTEAKLAMGHGVSRSVVREALAALRGDGLITSRQGAGVFVQDLAERPAPTPKIKTCSDDAPFDIQELRAAVECEAARLAALRRSPSQMRMIEARAEALIGLAAEGKPTAEADFALHFAIARASNNARFCDILLMLGIDAIPLGRGRPLTSSPAVVEEHRDIVEAIRHGNSEFARAAMRDHLEASMTRARTKQFSPM